jgi:hypothetical protein
MPSEYRGTGGLFHLFGLMPSEYRGTGGLFHLFGLIPRNRRGLPPIQPDVQALNGEKQGIKVK